MTAVMTAARNVERLLRDAERGLADPDRLLAPLAVLTDRLNGVAGVGPGGVLWCDDSWSWLTWAWRLRDLVRDWVSAGRVLDRRELRRLKTQGGPLFAAARQASECLV